jgi:hypothetical protein
VITTAYQGELVMEYAFVCILAIVIIGTALVKVYSYFTRKKGTVDLSATSATYRPSSYVSNSDRRDITTYRTTKEIFESGLFTAEERRREYRRRGKSPSGVIDGVYNDSHRDEGESYNDSKRDWDADA